MIRKLILILLILTGKFWSAGAQEYPKYSEVLYKFCESYEFEPEFYGFNFIKSKRGWEIEFCHIDTSSNEYIPDSVNLFWDLKTDSFVRLPLNPNRHFSSNDNIYNSHYFRNKISTYHYDYDYSLYYGYSGDCDDAIKVLESKDKLTQEGYLQLARAYQKKYQNIIRDYLFSSDSNYYLNYNIPQKTIDSFINTVNKNIEIYKILLKIDPSKKTLVGSMQTKLTNEYLSTWHILMSLNQPKLAQKYLDMTEYDSLSLAFGKKILDQLPLNAIFITDLDNETYLSWYLQAKLNYRKDITVLNSSLINIPRYFKLYNNISIFKRLDSLDLQYNKSRPFKNDYYLSDIAARQNFEINDFLKNDNARINGIAFANGQHIITGKNKFPVFLNYSLNENTILILNIVKAYGGLVYFSEMATYNYSELAFKKVNLHYIVNFNTDLLESAKTFDTSALFLYYKHEIIENKMNLKIFNDPNFVFIYFQSDLFNDFLLISDYLIKRDSFALTRQFNKYTYELIPKTGYALNKSWAKLIDLAKRSYDEAINRETINLILKQISIYYCVNKFYTENNGKYYNALKVILDIDKTIKSIKDFLDQNYHVIEFRQIENAIINVQTTCSKKHYTKAQALQILE